MTYLQHNHNLILHFKQIKMPSEINGLCYLKLKAYVNKPPLRNMLNKSTERKWKPCDWTRLKWCAVPSVQFHTAIVNNMTNIYCQCTSYIHSKPQEDSDAALRFNHRVFVHLFVCLFLAKYLSFPHELASLVLIKCHCTFY